MEVHDENFFGTLRPMCAPTFLIHSGATDANTQSEWLCCLQYGYTALKHFVHTQTHLMASIFQNTVSELVVFLSQIYSCPSLSQSPAETVGQSHWASALPGVSVYLPAYCTPVQYYVVMLLGNSQ